MLPDDTDTAGRHCAPEQSFLKM